MVSFDEFGRETNLTLLSHALDDVYRINILPAVGPLPTSRRQTELVSTQLEVNRTPIVDGDDTEEVTLPEVNDDGLSERIKKFQGKACEVAVFEKSSDDLLQIIIDKAQIDGVNLSEKIQDPAFRFLSSLKGEVELSYKLSEALALTVSNAITVARKTPVLAAAKKRNQTADEFALQMHDIVEKIKVEDNVTTYRATVEALNKREISSYTGGKWHVKTLHELYARWNGINEVNSKPSN